MAQTHLQTIDSYLKKNALLTAMNVQEFCKNRIDEILMLTEALKESPFRGQAFQRLPKHMRRRQMSHYIKRLPRRLRNSSLLSMQDDGSGLPKCPSRKFRRRPANLLLEYTRRQKHSFWLETHIWHARRFHMTSKWGYSLPEKPTNKSCRACYRATTNHCFISDMSYYSVIELNGQENILLEGLQQCVSTNCGLTFAAKMFKSGSREGFVIMYHPNSFPYGVIGEVSFLWKPIESDDEDRTIWIYVHPSSYNEITDVFKTLFRLNEVESTEEAASAEVKSEKIPDNKRTEEIIQKPSKMESESKAKNIFFHQIPEFINKNRSVTMKLMKNKINRFRLTGPLSLAVLSNAFDVVKSYFSGKVLHMKSVSEKSDSQSKNPKMPKRDYSQITDNESMETTKRMKMDKSGHDLNRETNKSNYSWWNRFYKNEFRKKCLENQANFYKSLSNFLTPNDLPPGMVFSIVVKDPRLTIPTKRMKCTPVIKDTDRQWLTSPDPSLSYSALWEADVVEEVCNNKIPTAEINRARAKLIVPGSDVGNILRVDQQANVPLIIIQRTSLGVTNPLDRRDFGSGFDILVPPGWAMPVWLSLVYRGARPGGLRETKSIILESKNLREYIQPDSRAGESENLEMYNNLRSIYFKRPPSKRQNFAKIGVQSPFYFPWKALVNDWSRVEPPSQSESELKFYVLRDLKKLSQLSDMLRNTMSEQQQQNQCIDSVGIDDMNCLVPISVESCGKGAPKENAMLCVPTPGDVKRFKNGKVCPAENEHVDPHFKTRKALKLEHAKALKSLKRKRRIYKIKRSEENEGLPNSDNKEKENSENVNQEKIVVSRDIVDKYVKEMEALWLKDPQSIDTVMNSCSRTLLGYVVLGGFALSQASGMGLGYITLRGLLFLLKRNEEGTPPFVLFRNNNFVKYRFGKIQICTSEKY